MGTASIVSVLSMLLATTAPAERRVDVADDAALRRAIEGARPGTRIVVAAGRYAGGIAARGLVGTAAAPIVIEAADPRNKPVIQGGAAGLHLSGCAHVVLRNLIVRGQSANGINIDDGGAGDAPAHHVTLEGIEVADVGPRGNRDGIKLSGVDDLVLRGCTVTDWAGQGIDMVGCHRALIEECTFRNKDGLGPTSGVQAKGGSSQVTVRRCTFVNAGQRAINIGGSTGLPYFRPRGAKYEAREVTVEGCRFVGSLSPIAFVGVDGATVRYNTIVRPEKWVVRILQETAEPGFVACRNGVFERNLIIYRRASVREVVNVGRGTEPATFRFRANLWYCEDQPAQSRPPLPAPEEGGVYGIDPKVALGPAGIPQSPATPAAKGYGAEGLGRE